MKLIKSYQQDEDFALKIEVNSETIEIAERLKNVVETIVDEYSTYIVGDSEIQPIECRRRDGFIPDRSNKGGFEVLIYADMREFDNEKVRDEMEHVYNSIKHCYEEEYGLDFVDDLFSEDQSKVDRAEDFEKDREDEYFAMLDIRALFLGFDHNIGKYEAEIGLGLRIKDAPYFRSVNGNIWNPCDIEFKNVKELEVELLEVKKYLLSTLY